jgi:hypothetical protein
MKNKFLTMGVAAAAALLLGGAACAQSANPGPRSGPHMHDEDAGRIGPGTMRQHMMQQMGRAMGPGMMHGMGGHDHMGAGMQGPMRRGMTGSGMMGMMGMMGMNHGSATLSEHEDLATLFSDHERIRRTVTNLPDGIRTLTESDDPRIAAVIKRHVSEMGRRVEQGRDPGLPIESDALRSIFRNKDKIKSAYEVTEKGVVVQTSTDAETVRLLQTHAAEVTELTRRGMIAAHEAMMRNGGMMRHGMHGPMGGPAR